jgi:signal transduction histidine kinase
MEEQGTLTLATRISDDRKRACLDVSDTGSGIQAEDVSKIFDPFFTTKALGKGTGLGLSMAYGVMEDNQGKIYVGRTGSEGTTFVIELPIVTLSNEVLFDSIG